MNTGIIASAKALLKTLSAGVQNAPLIAAVSVLMTVLLTAGSSVASTNYHSDKTQQACETAIADWDAANAEFATAAEAGIAALEAAGTDDNSDFSDTEDGAASMSSVTELAAAHAGELSVTCKDRNSAAAIAQQAEEIAADAQALTEATETLNASLEAHQVSSEYDDVMAEIEQANADIEQARTAAEEALENAQNTDGYTDTAKISTLQLTLESLTPIDPDVALQTQDAIAAMRAQLSETASKVAAAESATTALNDAVTAYEEEAAQKAAEEAEAEASRQAAEEAEAEASREAAEEAAEEENSDEADNTSDSARDSRDSRDEQTEDDVVLTAYQCDGNQTWIYTTGQGWTHGSAIQDARDHCDSWE